MDEWVVRAANSTTYTPFGSFYDGQCIETIANPWKFTGQWHDAEIDQYHLRARQYDPTMMRFTSRDPVRGFRENPLTLHKYLYCLNNSSNRVDPSGEISATSLASAVVTGYSLYGHGVSLAAYSVETGDERFWKLAELTFNFIPVAITVASFNPYGPATNLATFAAVRLNQMAYGSTTGMSTVQGLAVDPLAFLLYRGVMGTAHKYIGTDANDMQNFMSWMGVDWLDR